MLVSAVIIFLNGERFLDEAVRSVFAQSFTDWELLLCDDGSAEPAATVAKRYAQQHPAKVRYLDHAGHANRGMSATRNLGLRHARGQYIAWLDADDVWLPDHLSRLVLALDGAPGAAMAYGPLRYWYGWTGRPADAARDFTQDIGVPTNVMIRPPQLFCRFVVDDDHIPAGVCVRRSVLQSVGGCEESFRDQYEDAFAHAKVCLEHPAVAVPEPGYLYRQHAESACHAAHRAGQFRPTRIAYLDRLAEYLTRRGVTEGPAWDALQRALRPYRHRRLDRVRARLLHHGSRAKRVALSVLPGRVRQRLRAWRWGVPADLGS